MNKEEQNTYQREWRRKNPERVKSIRKKSEARPERIEYRRAWQKTPKAKAIREKFNRSDKRKEYDRKWIKDNPDKIKAKFKKYYYSTKGIVNYLKKRDKRKFGVINQEITILLIDTVNRRDLNCVYCGKILSDMKSEYDHLIPFKKFSDKNIVRCCLSCNRSKGNANVFEWCSFMKYKPLQIVYDLYNQQNDNKFYKYT